MIRRAVYSLAVLGAMGFGAAQANAALTDREGDPVVVDGSAVPGLIGKSPAQIVAFKFDGGWQQVPVQIDERKTIDVRALYPYPGPPYVGGDGAAFDLEIYTDEKTRAGADTDLNLDADDELAFMARDTGGRAVSGSEPAPEGVTPEPGTELKVDDPVNGGSGYLYLFRSAGQLDPSAGKRYVDYDFKLTGLAPGQTLLADYSYWNSNNPEDSTVSTPYYSTHSTDRWMDDRIEIHADGASGVDILDREVAQASLAGCGRNQNTFSGNWDRNGDSDEGTFVALRSGPVRVIRSYMGANSGPYTQREHIFYERREDNQIFLRVHPMGDLYSWTDYADTAAGMTYRNFKNQAGVTVDGNPDALVPPTTGDFTGGNVAWEQIVGPQGSLNTVTSVKTDIPNAAFGSYYLDDSTPDGAYEVQCSGDQKSYGASGFGILGRESDGVTPNTDPRTGPGTFNNLTVNRVRYFGGPGSDAAEAAREADRVKTPLAAVAATFEPGEKTTPKPMPGMNVKVAQKSFRVKPGRKVKLRVVVRNSGKATLQGIGTCLSGPKGKLGGLGCQKRGSLGSGKQRIVTPVVKVKRSAKKGQKLKLRLTVKATGVKSVTGNITIKVK